MAQTVGSGLIETPTGPHGLLVVTGAVVGAIVWNLITWFFGLPSSSSHALIGGLVGSAIAASSGVQWAGVLDKVVIPMVLSPVVGFLGAYLLMTAILWVFRAASPTRASRRFRLTQTISATAMALGHGLQDAQKTMGVIVLALVTAGYQEDFDVPVWVILLVASALSLGTYAGGWRIIRTLGRRIVALDPPRGFAAESTAATVLYVTAFVCGSGLHDPHDRFCGAGCRRNEAAFCGAMGDCAEHCCRLGLHHPRSRLHRGHRLLAAPPGDSRVAEFGRQEDVMSPHPERRPQLRAGWHLGPDDGTCLMEHVSQLAGLKFTDTPRCTDPLLAALAQLVNDAVSDRTRPLLLRFAHQLAGRPRGGRGSAPAIVLAVLEPALEHSSRKRDLRRHQARARRRVAATRDGRSSAVLGRLVDEVYRRGPARHALMSAVRAVAETQPDSARDRLLNSMLETAIAIAGPARTSVATGPDGRPEHDEAFS